MALLPGLPTLLPKPAAVSPGRSQGLDAVNADGAESSPPADSMSFTCQGCIRRKIKCDKACPACSNCSKARMDCIYEAPPPRKRKRKHTETIHERLGRYEQTLRDNGLLNNEKLAASTTRTPSDHKDPLRRLSEDTEQPGTPVGKLLSAESKTRYIGSVLWRDLGDDDLQDFSDEEDDFAVVDPGIELDPVSGVLLGVTQALNGYHPDRSEALRLWSAFIKNVEPLCKVLHVPTVESMISSVTLDPSTASKAEQCLLFAIYHFAILSMSEEECLSGNGRSQTSLLQKYSFAIRLALVNASWLKTTDIEVLRALVLYLIAIRARVDITEYWIFTGIAVRIAQRIGLHRDGESLGLPFFEVEMRRRLFWQLYPLDGYAGGASGTGIAATSDIWDTKSPGNFNDSDIYPGMTHQPQERIGATEMIYCLCRNELTSLYVGMRMGLNEAVGPGSRSSAEIEKLIDKAESTVEMKFLRYCDVAVQPLHFLVSGTARAAVNSARLRNRMMTFFNGTNTGEETRHLCTLAQSVLRSYSATYRSEQARRFRWKMESFSIWEALICILSSLPRTDLWTRDEKDAVWEDVMAVYTSHPQTFTIKGPLRIAVGRLTLDAWIANPPSNAFPEPDFIASLRSQRVARVSKSQALAEMHRDREARAIDQATDQTRDEEFTAVPTGLDDAQGQIFEQSDLNEADWMFWDQLIRDFQFSQDKVDR